MHPRFKGSARVLLCMILIKRVDLSTTKSFSHPNSTASSLRNGSNPNSQVHPHRCSWRGAMAGNRCSPRRRSGVRTRALSQPAAPHEPHIRSTRPTPDSPPCDLTSSSDRPAVVPCTQPPKRDAQDARHVPCRPTTPGVSQHHSLRGDSSEASSCRWAAERWRRRRR